ncbi:putative RING-H2 finger protein ATL69 [Ananas comosus]|uniref:Putative RING-H2 finger protein ATL69 n=1 Tax=Ananas comosus TaxID=4615 RepID=A0A199VWZ8_ANACO|nr:putative RING-H2 finger protein ATL69 [Ananas comosus]
MSSSDSSWAASTLPDSPAPAAAAAAAAAAAGVGLGYGIAIAVGILVLVSTIMLASYLCVRAKGTSSSSPSPPLPTHHHRHHHHHPRSPTTSEMAVAVGLDDAAIDAFYPKFACGAGKEEPAAVVGTCAICLGECEAGEAVRRGTECGHGFHAGCAERWLRVSAACPLCRSSPSPSPRHHAGSHPALRAHPPRPPRQMKLDLAPLPVVFCGSKGLS